MAQLTDAQLDQNIFQLYNSLKFVVGNPSSAYRTNAKNFLIDDDGYPSCYAVGSSYPSKLNGVRVEAAGCGIYYNKSHQGIRAIPLPSGDPATKESAELRAAIIAILMAKILFKLDRITIITESKYVIDGISSVVKDWVNARTMRSGDQLEQKKMFHELMVAMYGIKMKFALIEGHSGILGKDTAAWLAHGACVRFQMQNKHDFVSHTPAKMFELVFGPMPTPKPGSLVRRVLRRRKPDRYFKPY